MRSEFWMVVGSGVPYYKHASAESAKREAERLARSMPGQEFTVLKSLATVVVNDVRWEATGEDKGDVPF